MMNLYHDLGVAIHRTANENYRMWWSKIEVDHESDQFDPNYYQYIKSKFAKIPSAGIYIYEYEGANGPQTLYIGKSQLLHSRLWCHYKERHGQTGMPKWQVFWGNYKHKMNVYYQVIGYDGDKDVDEALRIITERFLIATIKPISESIYKSVK